MIRAPRTAGRLAGLVGLGAVLVALAASPAQAANDKYVAMGDSYSSGTGTRDYFESNCERSNFAYHRLLDNTLPGSPTAAVVACGGARTNNITGGGQHGNPGQGNDPALGANTEYVTISIGGNDAGFSDVLVQCGLPLVSCDDDLDTAENTIRNDLPGRLDSVYNLIRSRAPSARVTVVGYPRIFNGDDCNAATFFSGGEISRMNGMADLLADTTRARAQAHGFGFADARGAFLGHAVCDSPEWINGLSNPTGESYHPNKLGHADGYEGIVGSALRSQASPTDVRGPNGRIAFTRGGDVLVVNGNGSFPASLPSNSASNDTDPAFSPDGTKIAFASDRDGDNEIYVVASDGSGPVSKLTSNTSDDREPAWSPNGAYIAFRSNRNGNNDIFKMTALGVSQDRLTANADSEFAPAWSPDGAEIAYQRFGTQNDVWKMNSDGQGQTRLTTDGANDGAPEYSPSGAQIAFHSNRGGGDFEIFTMNATGGSQTQRTNNSADDEDPAWAPSGTQIAFSSDRDGDDELYTMTSTGGSQTRRTTSSGADAIPSWQGDKTPPATTFAAEPQGVINTSTPTFTFSADELGSTFECKVDSGAFASCSSPNQTPVLAEGSHTFQVRAIDPSGNVDTSPAQRTITIEAPIQTAITAGPSGPIKQTNATFEFDAADPSTEFTCSVDDDVVADPCTSPFTTATLADGPHEFTVSGSDGVNVSTDSSGFIVDTVLPDTSLVSGPGAVTNQMRPSFELGAEEGATFQCRIDGDPFADCPTPFSPPEDLADGPHTFEARATDPAGNEEALPLSVAFDVDTETPDSSIDVSPPPVIGPDPGQVTYEFSSPDETASFECRFDSLDDADWAGCSSPHQTGALSGGDHVFEVRAVDPAGNTGPISTQRFTLDDVAPETAITAGPADGAEVKVAAYEFSSPDDSGATLACQVDGTESDCESGEALLAPGGGPLSEGDHTFEVRAVDQVGNEDATPEERTFTIDRTKPPTPVIATTPPASKDTTPTFSFSIAGDDAQSFECRVDGAAFAPCDSASAHTPGALAEGNHTFEVRAVDEAGNEGDAATRSIRIDVTAPVPTIAGPSLTNDPTPTFSLTASEDVDFACKVDSQDIECNDSVTPPPLAHGDHTVSVIATDEAGNDATASKPFVVDTVAPQTAPGSAEPVGTIANRTPTITFSGTGADGFECRVDSAEFGECASPWTTPSLADGPHRVDVRALDAAGNRDGSPASWAFTVDTTAPQVTIDGGPREATREASHVFTFSAPGAAKFECALDGGAFATCASPYSTGPLAFGDHTFAVRASDAVGNQSPAATRAFTIVQASNVFSIAKPKKNTKRGTADLFVTVPDPGRLELKGKGLRTASKAAKKPGTFKLRVAATGSAARRLASEGALKVVAKVTFTPDGGDARTQSKRIKLVRK